MARFSIRGGSIHQHMGDWLARVAARVAASGLPGALREKHDPNAEFDVRNGDEAETIPNTDEFFERVDDNIVIDPSMQEAAAQYKRAAEAVRGADTTYVQFHFDRTVTVDGSTLKIVNVVVPDFANKLVRDPEGSPEIDSDGEPLTNLNNAAQESFGEIVMARCG